MAAKMPIDRPYYRTCRQFVDGSYTEGGRWMYALHPAFAQLPGQYIRAFQVIQKDLEELFDYIEPADTNLSCYSYRVHEVLLRACVEVEANCKAILLENGYSRSGDLRMEDYQKLELSHRLSSYEVRVPNWHGSRALWRPFEPWRHVPTKGPASSRTLPWYAAYNSAKHDRRGAFERATFENMLGAVTGLVAILSAQFHTHDFSPAGWGLGGGGPEDGMEAAIGGMFRVKFPDDWPIEDRYQFSWQALEAEADPFRKLQF